jgi:hypothetical protein
LDLQPLWLYDATKGSCDLSTSHYEDIAGVGCEFEGTWFYGTTMIFLWGSVPIRMSRLFVVFLLVGLP